MNPDEHLALARQLRADSSDLWDGGRVHLAAEALWGVVNHLASAVLKHETPEQLRQRRVQALLLADNLERVLVTMRPGEAR